MIKNFAGVDNILSFLNDQGMNDAFERNECFEKISEGAKKISGLFKKALDEVLTVMDN